jgi:hypothetical protein
VTPYYEDDFVTVHHGRAEDFVGFMDFDVVVTDPPYGRSWRQGRLKSLREADDSHAGITGDADTSTRDAVLAKCQTVPIVCFGDLMLAPPAGTKQVLVYRKPPNAGTRGAMGGFRRDAEAIYLIGPWPTGLGGRSSVVGTRARSQGNPSSPQGRFGHPHAKPVDLMDVLIEACPPGLILDPFMGSGSTLVAAKRVGRRAIGIEVDESYCEMAARRLSQEVLDFGGVA